MLVVLVFTCHGHPVVIMMMMMMIVVVVIVIFSPIILEKMPWCGDYWLMRDKCLYSGGHYIVSTTRLPNAG